MNTIIFKLLIAATVLSFLSSLAYIGINYQENEAAAQAPGRGQNPPGRGSAADIGCSNRERGRRRAAGQSRSWLTDTNLFTVVFCGFYGSVTQ